MLTLLWVILVGALVGYFATLVTGTDGKYGVVANIVIGIAGSFIAGLVTALFTGRDMAELGTFTLSSVLWSFLGAVGLILILNSFKVRRR